MNILITEKQEQILFGQILNEGAISDYCDKRLLIKDFLDKFFIRLSNTVTDDEGMPKKEEFVAVIDSNGKPLRAMTDKQLFELLEYKFKKILPESEKNQFIKDSIIAWYNRKISKNGTIISR